MVQNVLLVCIGNICRSPMTAAMLKNALGEQSGVSLSSAGIGALVGHPPDDHAIALVGERGLDINGHRARQLEPALIRAADLVLVMESGHRQLISELEPATRGKVSPVRVERPRCTGPIPATAGRVRRGAGPDRTRRQRLGGKNQHTSRMSKAE